MKKHIFVIIFFLFITTLYGEIVQMPPLLLRYKEIFRIANSLTDKLWPTKIPYSNVPVLAYDLQKKEEYLINFPKEPDEKFKAMDVSINGRKVYSKIGSLTLEYPGGQACYLLEGVPVITMGYGMNIPLENMLMTFLHEGFHFFQFACLYKAGIEETSQKLSHRMKDGARTKEYDKDLVVEAKLLYELTRDYPQFKHDKKKLQYLVAVETKRRKKLSAEFRQFEDYILLTEGSAVFVELTAMEYLFKNGIGESAIPKDTDPNYNYFDPVKFGPQYKANLQHYGATMLNNKINLPSTATGEITYRYALAMIRVLKNFNEKKNPEWTKKLFPFFVKAKDSKAAEEKFFAHLKSVNLSQLLLQCAELEQENIDSIYETALKSYLSEKDIKAIDEKIKIEANLADYPYEAGWTYRIDGKKFLLTYFNWLYGKAYADSTMWNYVYFSGLHKLETADKRLIVENIKIPVISNMFKGKVRFKDVGGKSYKKSLQLGKKVGNRYEEIKIILPGIQVTAKDVNVSHDMEKMETVIELK